MRNGDLLVNRTGLPGSAWSSSPRTPGVARSVRGGVDRAGRPVRQGTRVHPRPHAGRPRVRSQARQGHRRGQRPGDIMPGLAFHLCDQELSLRGIASRLVITKGEKRRAAPIPGGRLARAERARPGSRRKASAGQGLISLPPAAGHADLRLHQPAVPFWPIRPPLDLWQIPGATGNHFLPTCPREVPGTARRCGADAPHTRLADNDIRQGISGYLFGIGRPVVMPLTRVTSSRGTP